MKATYATHYVYVRIIELDTSSRRVEIQFCRDQFGVPTVPRQIGWFDLEKCTIKRIEVITSPVHDQRARTWSL